MSLIKGVYIWVVKLKDFSYSITYITAVRLWQTKDMNSLPELGSAASFSAFNPSTAVVFFSAAFFFLKPKIISE